jgi:hypothetical protein
MLRAIQELSVRPLVTLLIVILTLSVSGIASAVAATITEDDCCADGAESPRDEAPTEGHDNCPPLCHACACSPTFAVPAIATPDGFVAIARPAVISDPCSQLPASPPGRGVFHPPRCTA